MKYAFFDLDGTLIPVDSSIRWAETLLDHAAGNRETLKKERLQFDVDYHNGCLDIHKFEDFEMRLLASFPRSELDRLRAEYMRDLIKPHILPKAVELVEAYRRSGARVVMVTASYRYPVEPIAKLFNMDSLLCAEPEVGPEGEFTGRCAKENFAASKITGVRDYLRERGEPTDIIKQCVFYSDSKNDLPLLEFIADNGGKAVATNPDELLRQTAEARGWEILDLFSKDEMQ